MNTKASIFLSLVLLISACSDDKLPVKPVSDKLGNGFFVVNQGNFTLANSSLSFFDTDSAKMTNQLFFRANNVPLGDVAQSMVITGDLGYIVVNNSGIVYIINTHDATFAGKISGLQSPRYICFVSPDKAYISDLQLPALHIINPQNLQKTGMLQTGKSVEQMVLANDKVFALNWSNYYTTGQNNTMLVIDPVLDEVIDSLVLAKEPNSMVLDKDGFLWVLCSGGFMNEENAALFRINTETIEIEKRLDFQETGSAPFGLTIDGTGKKLFFINKNIYRLEISEVELPTEPFVEADLHNFYSLGVDHSTGQVIVSDAKNYIVDGQILRYTADGTVIDSVKAGVIPGQIVFN